MQWSNQWAITLAGKYQWFLIYFASRCMENTHIDICSRAMGCLYWYFCHLELGIMWNNARYIVIDTPFRCQAITWINASLLSIWPLRINFNEHQIQVRKLSLWQCENVVWSVFAIFAKVNGLKSCLILKSFFPFFSWENVNWMFAIFDMD